MLFTTLNFLFFLVAVLALFYIFPRPWRRYLLLACLVPAGVPAGPKTGAYP